MYLTIEFKLFQWKTIIFAKLIIIVSKATFIQLWCFQLWKYAFLKLQKLDDVSKRSGVNEENYKIRLKNMKWYLSQWENQLCSSSGISILRIVEMLILPKLIWKIPVGRPCNSWSRECEFEYHVGGYILLKKIN